MIKFYYCVTIVCLSVLAWIWVPYRHNYFISYATSAGFGNVCLKTNHSINSQEDIRGIEEGIQNEVGHVVIINWIGVWKCE